MQPTRVGIKQFGFVCPFMGSFLKDMCSVLRNRKGKNLRDKDDWNIKLFINLCINLWPIVPVKMVNRGNNRFSHQKHV